MNGLFGLYLICGLAAGVAIHQAARRVGDQWYLSPVVWSSSMLLLVFGLAPMYRIGQSPPNFGLSESIDSTKAAFVATLGCITFALGTVLLPRINRWRDDATTAIQSSKWAAKPRPIELSNGVSVMVIAVGLVYSVGAFSIYIGQIGGWGSFLAGRTRTSASVVSSAYLTAAPLVGAAAITSVIAVQSGSWLSMRVRVAAGLSSITLFLLVLPSGSRRFIVPVVLLPVMVASSCKSNPPRFRMLFLIALTSAVLLSSLTLLRSAGYREEQGGVVPIVSAIAESPLSLADRVLTGPDTEMLDFLAFQIEYVDQHAGPNYGFGLFQEAALQPIPSAVFGQKPFSDKEELLDHLYGEGCVGSGGHCPDYSIVGSFYRVASWPGVGILMLLLGFALAKAEQCLTSESVSPYQRQFLIALSVFSAIFMRKGLMEPALFVLYYFIPAAIFTWALLVPTRHRVVTQESAHGANTAQVR